MHRGRDLAYFRNAIKDLYHPMWQEWEKVDRDYDPDDYKIPMVGRGKGYWDRSYWVAKFGGSFLKEPDDFRNAALVARFMEWWGYMPVIVCSAMKGVTDKLIKAFEMAKSGQDPEEVIEEIFKGYYRVSESIGNEEVREKLESDFESVRVELLYDLKEREKTPAIYAHVISRGEYLSQLALQAAVKNIKRIPDYTDPYRKVSCESFAGEELLITDKNYTNASVLYDLSRQQVKKYFTLAPTDIYIVGGFSGRTLDGETSILGRGGSDLTATVLGALLNAREVVLYKDVEGIMRIDDKLLADVLDDPTVNLSDVLEIHGKDKLPENRPVKRLSLDEVLLLGRIADAEVIYHRALQPLALSGVPLAITSFEHPTTYGTLIGGKGIEERDLSVIIHAVRDLTRLRITLHPDPSIAPFSRTSQQIYRQLSELRIEPRHVSATNMWIDLYVDSSDVTNIGYTKIYNISRLPGVLSIRIDEDDNIIYVMGFGRAYRTELLDTVTRALTIEGIEAGMITLPGEEPIIPIQVSDDDFSLAVLSLFCEFSRMP